jgi:hypothetical protein
MQQMAEIGMTIESTCNKKSRSLMRELFFTEVGVVIVLCYKQTSAGSGVIVYDWIVFHVLAGLQV